MKQWVKKLLQQFDMEGPPHPEAHASSHPSTLDLSEDRATLLYVIDSYSKHLIEIDSRPVRKVRQIFDEFAKGLLKPAGPNTDKLLFRFRQFFSAYRIQEYSYLQKTFEDFKSIIWDFADQLNESIQHEQARDAQVRESLNQLREAVEANSIDELKSKSREFIDFYIELQTKHDERRTQRLNSIRQNLATVKKRLVEVHESARKDHLTGANNRKSFDESLAHAAHKLNTESVPASLITLDIDYFKKINDIFGHDVGDFVLKELVRLLKEVFNREDDVVARVGGEEFAVILPGINLMDAVKKAEETLARVRKEVLVQSDTQIRYTVSLGIAQLQEGEPVEKWIKRADNALYKSKNSGRDQYTVAPHSAVVGHVA